MSSSHKLSYAKRDHAIWNCKCTHIYLFVVVYVAYKKHFLFKQVVLFDHDNQAIITFRSQKMEENIQFSFDVTQNGASEYDLGTYSVIINLHYKSTNIFFLFYFLTTKWIFHISFFYKIVSKFAIRERWYCSQKRSC